MTNEDFLAAVKDCYIASERSARSILLCAVMRRLIQKEAELRAYLKTPGATLNKAREIDRGNENLRRILEKTLAMGRQGL